MARCGNHAAIVYAYLHEYWNDDFADADYWLATAADKLWWVFLDDHAVQFWDDAEHLDLPKISSVRARERFALWFVLS